MANRRRIVVKGPVSGEFHVNTDAVVAGSNRIGTIMEREGPAIAQGLQRQAQLILQEVAQEAVLVANTANGFPAPFQRHLMKVMKRIPVNVSVSPDGVSASIDLDVLGNTDDLRKAYHQGARLAGGGRVDGPYNGEALHNEDAAERHIFWEAIRRGSRTAPNPKGAGHVPVPDDASWDKTMRKYIEIWGDKAPEWLFIQFGQDKWNPPVAQYDILGNFNARFQRLAEAYLVDVVDEEVRIANLYASKGIDVGFTSKGSVRNKATGRFVKKITE